jgi:hypothetical protein
MIDEADRSLHDALSVLSQTVKETRVVYGGGCSEMLMANRVDDIAKRTEGKQAIAIEAFARALRQLPTILSDNAGYDSADLVSKLRAAHYEGKSDAGLGKQFQLCSLKHYTKLTLPLHRHDSRHYRLNEGDRYHRVIQAQKTGCNLCF